MADHKVGIEVPRVRDRGRDQEVPLAAYQLLREPRRAEEAALRKVLKGLSCREYEACVEPVAETFELKASSLSRRFKRALSRVQSELTRLNASAVNSLDEGLEETLTLHRLGLFKELGRSFKTTNCLENLNALVAQRTDKVDCWRNSDQKQRWLATALLDIEPRLRLVCGYKQMIRLRTALQMNLKGCLEAVA